MKVVATVNGDEIRASEYYRRMEFLPSNLASGQQGLNNLPAGFLTIKQLITEKLIFQMAKAKGVMPTQPEIDAEFKTVTTDNPKVLTDWLADGRSEEDLKYSIKYDLTQFKIRTAGITITDLEVEKHYKDNPTEFTSPRTYRLRVIVVADPTEQKAVDSELAAGKAFAEVAKAHSLDVTKVNGGEFGVSPEEALAPAYKPAIIATPQGKTTDWLGVNSPNGTDTKLKFLVEEIKPSTLQPLTPTLKRQLRKRLMLDKGGVKNNVLKDLTAATVAAKIEINQPLFNRLYKDLQSQFAKAQQGD